MGNRVLLTGAPQDLNTLVFLKSTNYNRNSKQWYEVIRNKLKNWNDKIKHLWDMTKSIHLGSAGTPVGRIKVKLSASIDLANLLQRSDTAYHLQPRLNWTPQNWNSLLSFRQLTVHCRQMNNRNLSFFGKKKNLGSRTSNKPPCSRLIDRGCFVTMETCSCRYCGLT